MNYLYLKKIFFIAFIIVIPLILVNTQTQRIEQNILFQISGAAGRLIQNIYSAYANSISKTISQWTSLLSVKKTNARLKGENAKLKIQLSRIKELEIKNRHFKNLLQFKNESQFSLLPAEITARDPFPEYHTLTINKGAKHGVKKNMLALVESGVAGYVFRVEKKSAQIILLSNRNTALPAIVQRSRSAGLIEGQGRKKFKLNYIKNEDGAKQGDIIVTYPISKDFPAGLLVGEVLKVEKDEYGLSQDIEVRPAVDFSSMEELFIVLYQNRHD